MVERPFADKRPFGPFIEETDDRGSSGILEARETANPELVIEVDDAHNTNEVFDIVDNNAKFDVYDVRVRAEEGKMYTREPVSHIIQIISGDQMVDLIDLQHLADVIENRYTVFETKVSASIERDPAMLDISNPFEGFEFVEEETEVE